MTNKKKTIPRARGLSSPVRVIETGLRCNKPPDRPLEVGEEFRSISWAECSTGIGRAHIVQQLSGFIPAARGVRFEYVDSTEDVKKKVLKSKRKSARHKAESKRRWDEAKRAELEAARASGKYETISGTREVVVNDEWIYN